MFCQFHGAEMDEAADFPRSGLKVSCSISTPYPTKEHKSIVLSLHKLMEEGSPM